MGHRKKIVVFGEGPVAAGSVVDSFNGSFRNTDIKLAHAKDIKHNPLTLDSNTLAFVLPGIVGEHSPYKDLLGKEGNQRIRRYVEEGGVFIGFCAGAYYACKTISYRTPWGITKSQRPGLDFFNATAKGPLSHKGQQFIDNDRWSDVTVVQIEYKDGKDMKRKAGICYGNGPALANIKDSDIDVIARYTKIPERPVAMASRRIGKGLAIFVGVHPEISSAHVLEDGALAKLPHVKKLITELSPHEPERKIFWQYITDMIKDHNIQCGRARKSLLQPKP